MMRALTRGPYEAWSEEKKTKKKGKEKKKEEFTFLFLKRPIKWLHAPSVVYIKTIGVTTYA